MEFDRRNRVVPYLCDRCGRVVRLDLIQDEIRSSSTTSSFRAVRQQRTILVVSDCHATRAVVTEMLQGAGHQVVAVGDGPAALEEIHRLHPDLVVSDLLLPGMHTFDLLRAVHSEARLAATPILVLTNLYKPEVVRTLKELGAAGWMDKDQLVSTLLFRVRSLLAQVEGQAAQPSEAGRPGLRY